MVVILHFFSALLIFQTDLKKAQEKAPEDKGEKFVFSIFSSTVLLPHLHN